MDNQKKAEILYGDIGDYLSREEKLAKLRQGRSFFGIDLNPIHPNEHGDWLTTRDEAFQNYIPLESEKKFAGNSRGFFEGYSLGIASNKDAFVYNFSKTKMIESVGQMVSFYNDQRVKFNASSKGTSAKDFVQYDPSRIVWTDLFLKGINDNKALTADVKNVAVSLYRPFCKQSFFYEKQLLQRTYRQTELFPSPSSQNLVICVPGISGHKLFSPIISNCIADLHFNGDSQCFPLYYYEENKGEKQGALFDRTKSEKYTRRDGISDHIHKLALEQYGSDVTREDIFYYVYGILHSKEYRTRFADDLKKSLPRLPLVDRRGDFEIFSKAGRALANLHLNYENQKPSKQVRVMGEEYQNYHVTKMRFGKKGRDKDKTIIQYNDWIRLENIPLDAYEYEVNGKSALEWVMERYAISTDKSSGIVNDPNDWAKEHGKPRYILDLLLSLITVSVETLKIVRGLPKVF